MTLLAEDISPALAGTQVGIGATVQLIDTSTDQNENLSLIKVSWGDNTSVTMAPGGMANHAYAKAGNRTITLIATDLKGLKSTVKTKIKVIK
jgi:PKD repeat protein